MANGDDREKHGVIRIGEKRAVLSEPERPEAKMTVPSLAEKGKEETAFGKPGGREFCNVGEMGDGYCSKGTQK